MFVSFLNYTIALENFLFLLLLKRGTLLRMNGKSGGESRRKRQRKETNLSSTTSFSRFSFAIFTLSPPHFPFLDETKKSFKSNHIISGQFPVSGIFRAGGILHNNRFLSRTVTIYSIAGRHFLAQTIEIPPPCKISLTGNQPLRKKRILRKIIQGRDFTYHSYLRI